MSYSTRWKVIESHRRIGIECDEGWQVAHWIAPGIDQKAAIARIVAAVNQHEALVTQRDELLAACEDLLSGWKYIRQVHGDLYGVGWDRAQQAGETAVANAKAGAK